MTFKISLKSVLRLSHETVTDRQIDSYFKIYNIRMTDESFKHTSELPSTTAYV